MEGVSGVAIAKLAPQPVLRVALCTQPLLTDTGHQPACHCLVHMTTARPVLKQHAAGVCVPAAASVACPRRMTQFSASRCELLYMMAVQAHGFDYHTEPAGHRAWCYCTCLSCAGVGPAGRSG
jgi:hypothetical protein